MILRTPSLLTDSLEDLAALGAELTALSEDAPLLLVTGPNIVRSGIADRVIAVLNASGLTVEVFEKKSGEPDDGDIEEGAALYRQKGCRAVAAVGGGSQLDTAKAVAVLAGYGGSVAQYKGVGQVPGPVAPLIAIATTAGSGSEVTPYTVITIRESGEKILIASPFLVPKIAVSDATLMTSVPKELIATSGVDALCHALESFVSLKATPFSRRYALGALRGIASSLLRVVRNPQDIAAYREQARAAADAGMAIANGPVTLLHGMSRPFGAAFGIGHGLANALLLPVWADFTLPSVPELLQRIAVALEVRQEDVLPVIRKLLSEIGIPSIKKFIPERSLLEKKTAIMAEQALSSGSPGNNPNPVDAEQICGLYLQAWDEG